MKDIRAHYEEFIGCVEREIMVSGDVSMFLIKDDSLGIVALASNGVSRHILVTGDSNHIYQEAVIAVPKAQLGQIISPFAQLISQWVSEHQAIYKNEVINIPEGLIRDSCLNRIFCCPPYFLDSGFHVLRRDAFPPVVFVWLVPIFESEYLFLKENGADGFLNLLEKSGSLVFDIHRQPLC